MMSFNKDVLAAVCERISDVDDGVRRLAMDCLPDILQGEDSAGVMAARTLGLVARSQSSSDQTVGVCSGSTCTHCPGRGAKYPRKCHVSSTRMFKRRQLDCERSRRECSLRNEHDSSRESPQRAEQFVQ